jgi:dihydropteroate synthase
MKITPLEVNNEEQAKKIMSSLGVSAGGVKILSPKSICAAFKIEGIKSWEANIIKQQLLSLGSDAALEREALVKNKKTSVFVFGNLSQLRKLSEKLKQQPFTLKEVSRFISEYLNASQKSEFVLRSRDKILKIRKPVICGIINLTDDSFSGDGLLKQVKGSAAKVKELALKQADEMIRAGAKIIDLGGESSRPFSRRINSAREIKRVIPVLEALRRRFKRVILSVDTYKYPVARSAVEAGVDLINDITALRASPRIAALIKKHKLGCVLMHMKGTPQTMQVNPRYRDVTEEIIDFFRARLKYCSLRGIKREQILIDPGIGFGKRLEDNIAIINGLYKFKILGLPIFLGLSRKTFIGKILKADAGERLIGTIAASLFSLAKGANILRVHDVSETAQAIKVASKLANNRWKLFWEF